MNDHSAASPSNNAASGKAADRSKCDRTQPKDSQNDRHSTDGSEESADAKPSDGAPADPSKKSEGKSSDETKAGGDKTSDACKAVDAADATAVQAATDVATLPTAPIPVPPTVPIAVVHVVATPVAAPILAAPQDAPHPPAASDNSVKPAAAPGNPASLDGTAGVIPLKNSSGPQNASGEISDDGKKTFADQSLPSGSQAAGGSAKEKTAQPVAANGTQDAVKTPAGGKTDNGANTEGIAQAPATAATAAAGDDDGKNVAMKTAGTPAGKPVENAPRDLPHFDGPAPAGGDISFTASAGLPQTQPIQLAQPTIATATNSPVPDGTLVPAAVPIAGLAVEIAGRALAGKNHFEIRLDPPELGRIDVHLNVDRNGQVTSHLVVDRPDTLNLLRQDSTGLERALQDAGLKTSDNGLQFSLRDQSMNQNGNMPAATPAIARVVIPDDTMPTIELPQRIYSRLTGMGGGLDIRV